MKRKSASWSLVARESKLSKQGTTTLRSMVIVKDRQERAEEEAEKGYVSGMALERARKVSELPKKKECDRVCG